MTEQQAQSPIDELFRKTFETLPDTPSENGWDQPSDAVWENIQRKAQPASKNWMKSAGLMLLGAVIIVSAIGIYLSQEKVQPAQPVLEQAVTPPATNEEKATPVSTDINGADMPQDAKAKSPTGKPRISPPINNEHPSQPNAHHSGQTAQPLPGSKKVVPPNSTEAQKQQESEHKNN